MSNDKTVVHYRFGRIELQPDERRLLVDGQPAAVGPRAFDLLVVLVERAGGLVTKGELLERVWPGLVVEEKHPTGIRAAQDSGAGGDRDDCRARLPVHAHP